MTAAVVLLALGVLVLAPSGRRWWWLIRWGRDDLMRRRDVVGMIAGPWLIVSGLIVAGAAWWSG